MADKKIHGFTLATALQDDMQLLTDIGGTVARKITIEQLSEYITVAQGQVTDSFLLNGKEEAVYQGYTEHIIPYVHKAGYKVIGTAAYCLSGSCEIQFNITNSAGVSTALGTTTNTVTQNMSFVTHTSSNDIPAGGGVELVVLTNTDAHSIMWTVIYERTLGA